MSIRRVQNQISRAKLDSFRFRKWILLFCRVLCLLGIGFSDYWSGLHDWLVAFCSIPSWKNKPITTALKAWQDTLRNKNVNSLNNLIAEDTVFYSPRALAWVSLRPFLGSLDDHRVKPYSRITPKQASPYSLALSFLSSWLWLAVSSALLCRVRLG